MSELTQVTVIKAANIYFDGLVTSRTVICADGSRKTLGIMQPGEFEFNTQAAELMEILSGELTVQLPGEDGWRSVQGGESFAVPANAKFTMRVARLTDYCCSFLP